jgi:hypothetical protein
VRHRFSDSIWYAVTGNPLILPSAFEDRLIAAFYVKPSHKSLFISLQDIPLQTTSRMSFEHDRAPTFVGRPVTDYLNFQYPNYWIDRCGPQVWPARSPDHPPLDICGATCRIRYGVPTQTADTKLFVRPHAGYGTVCRHKLQTPNCL